jgi:tRNA(Ile)-lysidine synthase
MPSTRDEPSVEDKVRRYLQRQGVEPGAAVLVAFSGGPDSRALLELLRRLSRGGALRLVAAHLDHGLRPTAERRAERRFVRETCSSLEVELVTGSIAPGALRRRARQGRGGAGAPDGHTGSGFPRSLEETARQARYRFLRRAARQTGCSYIALGHTLDDQVETVLMRFLQGAGPGGLAGIPERRGSLLRPLCRCSREEVLAFLRGAGLRYQMDSSNRELRFLRNAVRLRLVPITAEVFPGFRGSLLALAGRMRRLSAYLRQEARRQLRWESAPGGYRIRGQSFLQAPPPLRAPSFLSQLPSLGVPGTRLPYRFYRGLEDDGFLRRRRVLLSGHGLRLRWAGEYLLLERHIVCTGKKGYVIRVVGGRTVLVPKAGLMVAGSTAPAGGDRELVVRSYNLGDRIRIGKGSKELRKLFSEWRVPIGERWKIPILEDREGVVAVLGKPAGYPDRFRPDVSAGRQKTLRNIVDRIDGEVE